MPILIIFNIEADLILTKNRMKSYIMSMLGITGFDQGIERFNSYNTKR